MLLESGLAQTIQASASRSAYSDKLFAAEEKARSARLNVWKNWVPPAPVAEAPAEAVDESRAFEGDESVLHLKPTEMVDGASFYAQVVGNPGGFVIAIVSSSYIL